MNNAKWIESLRGKRHTDMSMDEAWTVQKMIVDGDLLHIDGRVVRALDELATTGRAEYLGVSISRESKGVFEVNDGGDIAIADSALEAIDMCEAHRSKYRATPLREPEPPTYDEALAMKCDAGAREWEARNLKGVV